MLNSGLFISRVPIRVQYIRKLLDELLFRRQVVLTETRTPKGPL
jgi:hypothetical protein